MYIEAIARFKGIKGNNPNHPEFEISLAKFYKSSALDSLMNEKKVTKDNQILNLLEICMPRASFEVMNNYKRFNGKFELLLLNRQNEHEAWEFGIGNFEISYTPDNLKYEDDSVLIKNAKVTVYPFGNITFSRLEEE